MGVFDSIGNWFRGAFGGESEEEKRRKRQQQQAQQSQPQIKIAQPKQPSIKLNTNQPLTFEKPQQQRVSLGQPQQTFSSDITRPTLPSDTKLTIATQPKQPKLFVNNQEVKATPSDPNKLAELDRLTQANLEQARKEASQGNSWFDNVFNRKNTEVRAEAIARNRATQQYQDRHGWVKDPTVLNYGHQTSANLAAETDRLKGQQDTLNNVLKKSSEIPVLSDFVAMGSGGASGIYKLFGDKQAAKDAHNNWTMTTLGMSDEDIAKLPPEQQDRLRKLQMGLTAASPVMSALDIASLGETGAAISGLKTAATTGGREALLQAAKAEGKNLGRNAAIAAVAAPAVGAPIQNYVNNGNALDFNGFDASTIPRQSATAALWSALLPGKAKRDAAASIVDGIAKETDPSVIQAALKINPEEAAQLARETTADGVKSAIERMSVDPNFKIDPTVQKQLEDAGVMSVKQDKNDPYAASYQDGTISARDQAALDANVYHEMAHSQWEQQLTPEEKALFKGQGAASQEAKGRAGYSADDVNSEDFSDYMNKAMTGRFDEVPQEFRAVIAKYAKIALDDPATSTATVQKIAQDSKTALDNFLRDNPNMTQQQVEEALQVSKQRAAQLINDFEQSRASSKQAIDQQLAANQVNTTQLQTQAEQAAAVQAAQNTPAPVPGVKTPTDPVVDPQLAANNAYGRDILDYLDEQQRRLTDAKENPLSRFFRVTKEQAYDPLAMFQKYDEKGAVGNDSIVSLMKRITNPEQAVEVRLKAPIRLPNGYQDSVWNIIKKYGKEDGAKAQEFANYRMFKDELWRISEGGQDPALNANPQDMAAYVQRYEAEHPDAVMDNAVLRDFALRNLKERADAGIDSQAIYEASAQNPFYTPRTRALARNKDLAMTHTGGFSTVAKSTAARTGADVAIAPLDLYRLDARNTEMGVLKNELGKNFYNRAQNGEQGFTTDVDPNVAVQHREAAKTFETAREDLQGLRELRDSLKSEKKMSAADLKAAGAKASKLEDQAITKMRQALDKAATDPQQTLHDVAARDPQYAVEKAQIEAQTLPNLTPKERREQIKYDLQQLDEKYPDPNITTRQELLSLAQSLDSGQYTPAQLAEQATTLRQQIPDLEARLDAITGQYNQSRQMVSEGKDAASQAWADLQDSTQHQTDFSGNTWTFKVDGEAGRGTAPAELAAEMSKLLEFAKPGSRANLLLRGTQAVGSATKAFWTGAFAPVWQTLNVAKNFGLMLHNGKWLSALSPRSFQGFVEGLVPVRQETRDFINALKSRGASYENITQSAAMRHMVADDIAARANIGTFLMRNPVNTFKDFYHMTSAAFTHVANAQRNAVAFDAYSRAIKAGIPQDQAMHMAVNEISNVFGDLQRVSELAQAMEPLIPYSGATQAGVRALINKAKTSPAEFALKQAAIISGGAALTWYSLQNNAQYYQDQIDKGYTTDLDNNFVIVLPGAKRDADGNWSGVVKIPVTPDFRPLNQATWRSAFAIANGQGVDPGMVAGQLFNEFTGQMAQSVYDSKVAEQAGTPVAGVFAGSPALNTVKILSGTNPSNGQPLSDSDMSLRPRTEQAYDTTSDAARRFSEMTGGAITPIQADKLLGQLGSTGRAVKDDTPGLGKFFDFKSALTGGKGVTDKQRETKQYFDNVDAVSRMIDPNDKKTLKEFQALHSKKTDQEGDNMMNSAVKAAQFMQYVGDGSFQTTPLFAAEKKLDDLQRQQGQPGNPIFDLPAQELQKVLMYRSLKAANAAGQNYSKGGESAFTALGLDDKWYQDFRDQEDAYYKALNLEGDSTRKSFSGKQEAQLTDEQRAAQNKYFSLDKAGRKAFLAANPWLKDFWAADNEFTDQERKALGFDSLNGDSTYDGQGSYGGYGGSSYNPADHINTLTELTNFSNSVNGDAIRKVEAQNIPNIIALFQKLKAGSGGGRSVPKLGASSNYRG